MPEIAEDVPQLIQTLKNSLKSGGKATVDVKKQAGGSADTASNFLKIAAREADVDISIKANKTSAIALVEAEDDGTDDDSGATPIEATATEEV